MTTTRHNSHDLAAQKIIEKIGKNIVVGTPLGIGKPIGFLNALYRIAAADPTIQLTIITGLTLARPTLNNELEKRFIEPILNRLLKNYEDPLYEKARELQQLPSNINVIEFFLSPGKYLHNSYVQQHYINSIYTSVVHDTMHYKANVFAQQVAFSDVSPEHYSLSSNTDLFHDATKAIRESASDSNNIAIVAEVNLNLPFMVGDALVDTSAFTDIIDSGNYPALFVVPKDEISVEDHLIGLYTSLLVQDDGCLQIGIGKLSTAVASALILRHQNNSVYKDLCQNLLIQEKFSSSITEKGALTPFEKGLYASTEMFSDDYLHLYNQGVLKKRVYDHIGLQQLLNAKKISETITPDFLEILLENKLISPQITPADFAFLQQFGIIKSEIKFQEGKFILPKGEKISGDLSSEKTRQHVKTECLGKTLTSGKILHAGFFMGAEDFYQQLHNMPLIEKQQFDMTSIARTNALSWSPELLQLQRENARLINSAMMVTLSGASISDGLKNLQEVSGVGGQFDFVLMAQQLKGSVSIMNCRSTRNSQKGLQSNILWNYPYVTIPRYLRDVIVTEYGIADCRSKTDCDTIKAILNIADSRFQQELLAQAKKWGKIPNDYQIPPIFQQNYPEKIHSVVREFQAKGYFKPYPFGTELTDDELVIKKALLSLQKSSKLKLAWLMCRSLFCTSKEMDAYLSRLQLSSPKNMKEFIYKKLLSLIISQSRQ